MCQIFAGQDLTTILTFQKVSARWPGNKHSSRGPLLVDTDGR